ncbi:class I SAM-dependent methyltransferase [Paractinoplanes deccanensis]|nr:class I SAM-dependent methyltransferase [Actinoplanes deccanensis]
MVNERQAERWNGESARRWLASRERHAAVRERLLPHLYRAAAVRPGERVLDVGCGCGDTSVALARTAREVVGIDISEPLLREARRAEAGNVRFVRGDAQVDPLGAFDVVVSSFGVMFFDDPVAAFRNLRRTGGRLAFLCWQDALVNEVFALPLRALGAPPAEDPFADPVWIRQTLTSAGYHGVRVQALHEPARLGDDVADVTAYAMESTLVRDLAAGNARARSLIEAAFAERQRPDGVWIEAAAYLVTAPRQGRDAGGWSAPIRGGPRGATGRGSARSGPAGGRGR